MTDLQWFNCNENKWNSLWIVSRWVATVTGSLHQPAPRGGFPHGQQVQANRPRAEGLSWQHCATCLGGSSGQFRGKHKVHHQHVRPHSGDCSAALPHAKAGGHPEQERSDTTHNGHQDWQEWGKYTRRQTESYYKGLIFTMVVSYTHVNRQSWQICYHYHIPSKITVYLHDLFMINCLVTGLHPPSNVAFGTSNPWPGPRLQKQKALICILLGCLQLFSHILKREFQESDTKHLSRKFTEWVYGPVTCSLYDLASVDSYENNSALEILVYGSGIPVSPITISSCSALMWFWNPVVFYQNRHEMLQTAPLGHLLESKWKNFAGQMFCLNFLFYLVYLIVFTVVAYHKRDEQVSLQPHSLWLVSEDTPVFTYLCFFTLSHSGCIIMKIHFRATCTSQAWCSQLWQTATSLSQGYITSTFSK